MKKILVAAFCALTGLMSCSTTQLSTPLTMYVGTYTGTGSCGLYSYTFHQDAEQAPYSQLNDSAAVGNPSFLVFDNHSRLCCVSEYAADQSAVTAFRVNHLEGTMVPMNSQPELGADPCYLSLVDGKVFVANYSSGDISVLPIDEEGKLGAASLLPIPERPETEAYHVHAVVPSPDGRYLFATDLGADCIYKFALGDTVKQVAPYCFHLPKGSGPRHMVFSNDAANLYVVTELSDEVVAFSYDAENGNLQHRQTLKLADVEAHGGGDIHLSPDGNFLYASERVVGDGIAIYRVQPDGLLEKVGFQPTGLHPRNFAITPNGAFLLAACRNSNLIQVFKRDSQTGLLDEADSISVPEPVCIQLVPQYSAE